MQPCDATVTLLVPMVYCQIEKVIVPLKITNITENWIGFVPGHPACIISLTFIPFKQISLRSQNLQQQQQQKKKNRKKERKSQSLKQHFS